LYKITEALQTIETNRKEYKRNQEKLSKIEKVKRMNIGFGGINS